MHSLCNCPVLFKRLDQVSQSSCRYISNVLAPHFPNGHLHLSPKLLELPTVCCVNFYIFPQSNSPKEKGGPKFDLW